MLLNKKIKIFSFSAFLTMFLLGLSLTSFAQSYGGNLPAGMPHNSAALLHVEMGSALKAGEVVGGLKLIDAPALRVFYNEGQKGLFWLDQESNHEKARIVLSNLELSWTHGLNPATYHVKDIRRILQNPFMQKAQQAKLDLLLSDAVIRYGQDLTGMRVDPAAIRQKSKFWRQPMGGMEILNKVSASADIQKTLTNLAPRGKLYTTLRRELVKLSKEKSDYDHLLPLAFGAPYFKPGERHASVSALRERMALPYDSEIGPRSFYDDELAASVMKFQKQHGLDPDGIIGPKTLALLNRTRRARMEQVVANLERLRWLEQKRPERYLIVNIPSQILWAIEKGKIAHEMPVVVGRPYRQTRSFKAEITGVRFNPTWTVPLKLKMQDFLPKLRKDPYALTDKGIEFIRGYGRNAITLDPGSINWENVSWREMGKIRMVQTPGDHNALGRIRILMQNGYDIYLHDTNHKEFFAREDRTLSSGCVRLSDPANIARFVMARNEGWSDRDMKRLLDEEKTVDVDATESLPVYILYQTVWLDSQGQLVFGPDVYKRDKRLVEVLAGMNGYDIPVSEGRLYAAGVPDQSVLASVQ